jgi:DNA-binding NarL/FixJ family response regulator
MKRCLLLEEHRLFREFLALLLEWGAELEAFQAGAVEEARRALAAPRNEIELAIVNIDSLTENPSSGNPLELIEELRRADPHLPVLALTASRSLERRAQALRAGATQVCDLSVSAEELVDSARLLVGAPQTRTATEIRSLLRDPA